MSRSIPGGKILPLFNVVLGVLAALGGSILAAGGIKADGFSYLVASGGLLGSIFLALLANVYVQRREIEFLSPVWQGVYQVCANLLIAVGVFVLMLLPLTQGLLFVVGMAALVKLVRLLRI